MYRVYCLRDKTDKIVYIGYTTRSLHNRWRSHKNQHPEREHLSIQLLQEVELKDMAKTLEIMYIRQYDTMHPKGLNIAFGHTNNDGEILLKTGKQTRFGTRMKYPGEEEKRKARAKEAISKICSKPVRCINTGQEYPSARACAKALNLNTSALSMVLRGKRAHTKGLRFEFIVPK
jgi:GIY-YIG catalytic domain